MERKARKSLTNLKRSVGRNNQEESLLDIKWT